MTTLVRSLDPNCSTPQQIAAGLRHPRTIENVIFNLRDVSYGKDHSHACFIGVVMS